jgi:tetratricopeptide (TPR) repeat protein
MQTVPSRVADYDPTFGKNVAVANLSLLNTNWYCKQLRRWGAPVSFSEDEIDRLPQYIIGRSTEYGQDGRTVRRERVMYLKDIMMRNIVATSAGIPLRWPEDYRTTSEEFIAKVFGIDSATSQSRYQARSPVYFATTVSPDNLNDVAPHLVLEGLVRRVVPTMEPAPGEGQVNVELSRDLLFSRYRTNSMLDPKVEKDDNTVGLMTNYAHSHLMLALAYQRLGQLSEAARVLAPALRFDLDSSQKALLYLNLSRFALLARQTDTALAAADSAEAYGRNDGRLARDIALQGGYAHEAAGDFEGAAALFQMGMDQSAERDKGMWVEMLYRLYVDAMHDTTRARQLLTEWLQRHPNDGGARQLLEELNPRPGPTG